MNKRFPLILATAAILLGIVNSLMWVRQGARAAPLSNPDVPGLISYQGRLTDVAGNPLTGDYDVRFCLYAAPTGGTALWCETHATVTDTAVNVTYGVFSVMLGSVTPIPDSVFDEPELHLGVKVETDDEMAPRRQIVSVGYAYRAEAAGISGYEIVTSSVTVDPETVQDLTVSCPSGKKVLGGGFSTDDDVIVFRNHPRDSTAWETWVLNPTTQAEGLTVTVICAMAQ
jgi:hypothetical protein